MNQIIIRRNNFLIKKIDYQNEDQPCLRKCYAAIRHNEGDIIRVRDCVLLRSGPRKTDLPFVAKISALWETPNEGLCLINIFKLILLHSIYY